MKLKIEYVSKEELKPYASNAKIHTGEQVEQIKSSIEQFGFNDPIAIWKDNEIIEGHGRLLAAMELDDLDEVPVVRLDHLTDEERRAYMLVHNQLTMNTNFDEGILELELGDISGIDMTEFGFDDLDVFQDESEEDIISRYSQLSKIPQYEPTGEKVETSDLYNDAKTKMLIEEIDESNISDEDKEFLRIAAQRHTVFNYRNIAEFYANADKDVQELMEKSALVIIDIEDAIANGYVKLSKTIQDLIDEDEYDE